jgi:hypothetical protein
LGLAVGFAERLEPSGLGVVRRLLPVQVLKPRLAPGRWRRRWPAPGSWPPPGPFQLIGGEAADDAALILRPGQLGRHHVSGAFGVSGLAQPFRDDRRAAKVNLERLAVVELFGG